MPRSYWSDKRVCITGGGGFVGRHLLSALMELGCEPRIIRQRAYDLRIEEDVTRMYSDAGKIDVLFHLAANVGGIGANQAHPARMYSDNVRMDTLLIDHATRHNVGCFVGMGSVCAYPKHAPLPFREETLWDGYPEETNAAYGMAKRGMLACLMAYGAEYGLNWRYALSTNLYGPGDNYTETGHVIAHLIKKFSDTPRTKSVEIWGDGKATRDFLYVGDVTRGLMTLAEYGVSEPVNLGSGQEIAVQELVGMIRAACGGSVYHFNMDKPNGQPRRVLDITRARGLGWVPETSLEDGLLNTIHAYRESVYA